MHLHKWMVEKGIDKLPGKTIIYNNLNLNIQKTKKKISM